MSLLTDLRAAADAIDPSLLPTSNEVVKIEGAIVAFLEHGEKFLQAAANGAADVSALLTPAAPAPVPAPAPAPAASAPAPAATVPVTETVTVDAGDNPSYEDLVRQVQSLAAGLGQAQKTQVVQEPATPEASE